MIRPRLEIVCLDKSEIRFPIVGRAFRHPDFLGGRKFSLQCAGNFVREICLNREDIGQLAIVFVRPEMLIVFGVDQLHVDAHTFAVTADTAFENGPST